MNLGTIDAIAVRLWLDRRIVPESPSNVLAGFDRYNEDLCVSQQPLQLQAARQMYAECKCYKVSTGDVYPELPLILLLNPCHRNVGATFFDLNALQDCYLASSNSVVEVRPVCHLAIDTPFQQTLMYMMSWNVPIYFA